MRRLLSKTKRISTFFLIASLIGAFIIPQTLLAVDNPTDSNGTQKAGVLNPEAERLNMAAGQQANFLNQPAENSQTIVFGFPPYGYLGVSRNITVTIDNENVTIEGQGPNVGGVQFSYTLLDRNGDVLVDGSTNIGDSFKEGRVHRARFTDIVFTEDGFRATTTLDEFFLGTEIPISDIDKIQFGRYGSSPGASVNESTSRTVSFAPFSTTQPPVSNNPSDPRVEPSSLANVPYSSEGQNSMPTQPFLSPISDNVVSRPINLSQDDGQWLSEKGLETWNVPSSHSVNNPFKPMILKVAEGFMVYKPFDPARLQALFDQFTERSEFSKISPVIEVISRILEFIPNQLGGILKTLFQLFEGLQEKLYEKHLLALRPYYESL